MATQAQIEANRRNSLLSTGPKTPEGKATVGRNPLKHGLSGAKGGVFDDQSERLIAEREARWAPEFPVQTAAQRFAFRQFVAASVQIDRSEEALAAHRLDHAARARSSWDQDRRAEAEEIADGLAKNPPRAVARLERSPHGVDVLLARWARLLEALDDSGDWTEDERSRALDLLGVPADLRRGRTSLDAPEGPDADPAAFRRALASSEIGRLSALRGALAFPDAVAREHASDTQGAELTRSGQLLRRYQREAISRFWRFRREVLPGGTAAPASRSSSAPKGAAASRPTAEVMAKLAQKLGVSVESLEAFNATGKLDIDEWGADADDLGPEDEADDSSLAIDDEEDVDDAPAPMAAPRRPVMAEVTCPAPPKLNRHQRRAAEARSRRGR